MIDTVDGVKYYVTDDHCNELYLGASPYVANLVAMVMDGNVVLMRS